MDLSSFAAALGFFTVITYGVVDRVKAAFPNLKATHLVIISAVVGLAVPFLIAYSTFGDQIPIAEAHLSDLNVPALLAVGLLGLGGASALHQTIGSGGSGGSGGAIANIGENQSD